MVILGIAFGLLELLVLGIFFLALVVGCTLDRRHDAEAAKWWILFIGLGVVAYIFWPSGAAPTFPGIWETVSSLEFWKPIGLYLGAGLLYCIPEFYMDVRRSAKKYAADWQAYISRQKTIYVLNEKGERVKVVKLDGGSGTRETEQTSQLGTVGKLISLARETGHAEYVDDARSEILSFVRNYRSRNRIVNADSTEDRLGVQPRINKVELAEHVSAWTIFWPAYLFSLVIGDLLAELWDIVADFLVNVSGRFVRRAFSDVFTVKS